MKSNLPIDETDYFRNLLRKAADFYEESAGANVADRFLCAVNEALKKIATFPDAGSPYVPPDGFDKLKKLHYKTRNLRAFSPFPYTIYYEIFVDKIVVQSIYHHARHREKLMLNEAEKQR